MKCAAIVLAAGSSRRMGCAKALLPLGDEPIIAHVVDTCCQVDLIEQILVVTGHMRDPISEAVARFDAAVVSNPSSESGGMISSIKAGLARIRDDVDAVFVVLGDQPLIAPSSFEALGAAINGPRSIVRPVHAGRHGHPILVGSGFIGEILQLPADATLKHFVRRHEPVVIGVPVDDPAILFDVDTPDDYRRALEMLALRQRSLLCEDEPATNLAAG